MCKSKAWLFYDNLIKIMELGNIPIVYGNRAAMARKERDLKIYIFGNRKMSGIGSEAPYSLYWHGSFYYT